MKKVDFERKQCTFPKKTLPFFVNGKQVLTNVFVWVNKRSIQQTWIPSTAYV